MTINSFSVCWMQTISAVHNELMSIPGLSECVENEFEAEDVKIIYINAIRLQREEEIRSCRCLSRPHSDKEDLSGLGHDYRMGIIPQSKSAAKSSLSKLCQFHSQSEH